MKSILPASYREEAAANLRLALPLIAAQITFMAAGVVDTLMAGRMGERELAAIAVGANLWMQLFILFMGVSMACSPIVAQRWGARQALPVIGSFVREAVLIAAGLGIVWLLLMRAIAGPIIGLLGITPETADLAHRYVMAESWSGLLFSLCFTLRSSAEGLGQSRVVLRAGLAALAAKIIANFIFVYGHAGVPAMGAVGFGWATVVSSVVMLIAYLLQYQRVPQLRELQLLRPGWPRLRRESLEVFRLGFPIGMILFAEVAFFGWTALLMARFGDTAVAAHQVALNFSSLVFMVPVGLGLATTVRVGHAVGAGAAAEALHRGKAGMLLGLVYALFSASFMGLKPDWITAAYTEAPDVALAAQTFLRFAALFQFFDCVQSTANGALRGIKDTQVPMLVTIVAYWVIGMPCAYVMAFVAGGGPNALWAGFIIGLGVAALGLSSRFLNKAGRLVSGQ